MKIEQVKEKWINQVWDSEEEGIVVGGFSRFVSNWLIKKFVPSIFFSTRPFHKYAVLNWFSIRSFTIHIGHYPLLPLFIDRTIIYRTILNSFFFVSTYISHDVYSVFFSLTCLTIFFFCISIGHINSMIFHVYLMISRMIIQVAP